MTSASRLLIRLAPLLVLLSGCGLLLGDLSGDHLADASSDSRLPCTSDGTVACSGRCGDLLDLLRRDCAHGLA